MLSYNVLTGLFFKKKSEHLAAVITGLLTKTCGWKTVIIDVETNVNDIHYNDVVSK